MYSSKAIIGQLQSIFLCKQCIIALALEKRRLWRRDATRLQRRSGGDSGAEVFPSSVDCAGELNSDQTRDQSTLISSGEHNLYHLTIFLHIKYLCA